MLETLLYKRFGNEGRVTTGLSGARAKVPVVPEDPMGFGSRLGTTTPVPQEPDWPPIAEFTDEELIKVKVMADNGIAFPNWTMQVCKLYGVPLFFECAFLSQESYGGKNLYHNDPTWMRGHDLDDVGITEVTELGYLIYLAQRADLGAQGMGPNGLTHPTWQSRADFLGGCWKPRSNMAAAVSYFRERLDAGDTMDAIATAYNPGSPTYLTTHQGFRREWRQRFQETLNA
jgi:hypothetical protein